MSATWDSKSTKTTPLAADEFLLIDTADSRNQKRATLDSLSIFSEIFTWTDNHDADGFDLLNVGGITISNPLDTFHYAITSSAITVDRIATLPLLTSDDTFVFADHIQTLTNKTLTTPTIASFLNATHDHSSSIGGGQLDATTSLDATGTTDFTTFLRGDNVWSSIFLNTLSDVEISGDSETITQIIDSTGDGTNAFTRPYGSIMDASGNVYVAAQSSDNVFKITSSGTITEIINSTGDGAGNVLTLPRVTAVDASGNVYVSGQNSDNVFKITSGGTITEIINSVGDGTNALDAPFGVTVDASENVYVAGRQSNNVFKITSGGTITEIINSVGDGTNALSLSFGIAVDASENVYVSGQGSNNVFKITSGGTITEIINSVGDGTHSLADPTGVAVDASENVYVSGQASDNAFKITSGGIITQIIDSTGGGTNILDSPFSIAVDASENVYIPSRSNDTAFKITSGGTITQIIDSTGDGTNTFDEPIYLTVNDTGTVIISGANSNNTFKIESGFDDGQILIFNGITSKMENKTMSGQATITFNGVVTVGQLTNSALISGVFDSIIGIGTQTQALDMGGFDISDIGTLQADQIELINSGTGINPILTSNDTTQLLLLNGNFEQNINIPVEVGSLTTGIQLNMVKGIYVYNEIAYTTAGNYFSTFDVSGSTPILLGYFVDSSLIGLSIFVDVDPIKNLAYLVRSNILTIIDVSDLANPVVEGTPLVNFTNLDGASCIRVLGDLAYVTTTPGRFTIVDISDTGNPEIVSSLLNATNLNGAVHLQVSGNIAYVASSESNSLTCIDVSDPTNPVTLGVLTDGINLDGANSVSLANGIAYVASSTSDSLTCIDVSDPTNPSVIGSILDGTNLDGANDVFTLGNIAYVVSLSSGIAMVDVSDPTDPVIINSAVALTSASPTRMFISQNHAYIVSNNNDRLTKVSITGITSPTAYFGYLEANNVFISSDVIIGNNLRAANMLIENDAVISGELTINGQLASQIGTTTFPIFFEDDFPSIPDNLITQIIDSTGDGTNSLSNPQGITTDSSGNIYVVATTSDNAFKISADLTTITEIINSTGDGTNILDSPQYITTDSSGNIFVTGLVSDNAFKISADLLTITEIINSIGDGTNSLDQPRGIATDTSGNIFVVGSISDNAFKISADLLTITEIINSIGDGTNTLDNPDGIDVDSSGNIYVGGRNSNNVFKISADLSTKTEIIDSVGDGTNSLSQPRGIAVDINDNIFVAGFVSDNAFKISADLSTKTEIIDSAGDGTNSLDGPQSIDTDSSGNIYVAGSVTDNAFKISSDLLTITEIIDSVGDGDNTLDNPLSITVDINDNIFVAGLNSNNAFKIVVSSGVHSLTSGLYLIKNSFIMSNALHIPASQNVIIQFEDPLNNTITYSGNGALVTGVSTINQLEIINCKFILSGVNAEFVNLLGGSYRMINSNVSFTGTGTKSIGTFDSNGIIAVFSTLFSGYNVGFAISNVGSIGVIDSFFVSDFTGTSSLFDIDSATGILGFNNFGVFVGATEAVFDIDSSITSTIQISTINSTILTGGEFYKTGSLNQTAINVDARQTPGFPDSTSIAYGTMNSNSTSTTITNGTYSAVDISTIISNSLSERFTLTDDVLGIWRYDGIEDFKGFLTGTLSALKVGSTTNYRFAVSIDSVVPTFATESFIPMEVKTTKVNIAIEFPLSLTTNQTFQLMVAGDGTSDSLTITDTMFGAQ